LAVAVVCAVAECGTDYNARQAAPTSLEKALADFGNEFTPDGARFQIFVVGRPRALPPTIQEQIYLIGREAIANAFHHSKATSIAVEVGYLPGKSGVIIHYNGCGIDPQAVRSQQNLHRGLWECANAPETLEHTSIFGAGVGQELQWKSLFDWPVVPRCFTR